MPIDREPRCDRRHIIILIVLVIVVIFGSLWFRHHMADVHEHPKVILVPK